MSWILLLHAPAKRLSALWRRSCCLFVRSYLRMFNRRRITRRLDRRMKDPLPDTGIARKLFGNAHGIALELFTQIRP